jgi:hypothetical protein
MSRLSHLAILKLFGLVSNFEYAWIMTGQLGLEWWN